MSVEATELVVRPSWRTRYYALAYIAAMMLVIVAPVGERLGREAALWAGVAVAVVSVPGAALVLMYLRRAEVAVTSTEIVVSGLSKQQRFPRSDAARLVHARLIAGRWTAYGNLFFLDHHGNRLARIFTIFYGEDDIRRVVAHLGMPVSAPDRPVTANQLATWYPGIVWFGERRPFATLAAAGTLIVLMTVLVTRL